MYYVSLKSINQEKKLKIPEQKLQITDELLSYLVADQTVSPNYIAHKSKVNYKLVVELLKELSFRDLIGVKFIIYCTNEDPDMVHGFDFDSDVELAEFIREHKGMCIHCDSKLDTKNVKVAFIIKDFDLYGDVDG